MSNDSKYTGDRKLIDHLKVYHEDCGSWNIPTKISMNHNPDRRYIAVEALCFHCGAYYVTDIHIPATKSGRKGNKRSQSGAERNSSHPQGISQIG